MDKLKPCTLTLERVETVLKERFGGVLREGSHEDGSCEVCVRELRAIACEIGWTDKPDNPETEVCSPTDRLCQSFNDAAWSSDAVRTKVCLPLALLSEHTAPEGWLQTLTTSIIREIVPIALRAAASIHPDKSHRDALDKAASECETNQTSAASAASAARAASYAASAASAASYAAEKDRVLTLGVHLLLKAHDRPDLVREETDLAKTA